MQKWLEVAVCGDLLRENPGLMLIGLEYGRDAATIFAANRQTIRSGEELARVIAAGQMDGERD